MPPTDPGVFPPRRERGAQQEAARELIDQLGVDRVASWCGVARNTVYQWLKRGSDAEPFPFRHALTVFEQADEAGTVIDIRVLCPWLPHWLTVSR